MQIFSFRLFIFYFECGEKSILAKTLDTYIGADENHNEIFVCALFMKKKNECETVV